MLRIGWPRLRKTLRTGPLALSAALALLFARLASAQGITTGAIGGFVRSSNANQSRDVAAHVRVVNTRTGFSVEVDARHGRFLAQGLEVGGPYTVLVRRLGFVPQRREGLFVPLGGQLQLEFVLEPVSAELEPIRVIASAENSFSHSSVGVSSIISDSLVHRLPTLNRDFYDFVRLSPQISTRVVLPGGGISGGGVNLRFDNYLIDGAPERYISGNSSIARGAKSVSIEAVKEYQVLLAPFDVRYGDFAGALINTVTKGGTNEFHGTIFAYERNDRLSGGKSVSTGVSPYEREQYGFSLGGPILRDRLHFFIAPEFQRLTSPAPGPYVGQSNSASTPLPVSSADVARFAEILRRYNLDPGSGGAVDTRNPLANLFARIDLALPNLRTRVVASHNYARRGSASFSRAASDTFPLSSYRLFMVNGSQLSSLRLHTTFGSGAYNEMIFSYRRGWTDLLPDVREPVVQLLVPRVGGGSEIIKAGTQESGQGVFNRETSTFVADNFTFPLGAANKALLGTQLEIFRYRQGGVNGSYGRWTFSSLDSLSAGIPQRFEAKKDLGSADATIAGRQYGIFAGDEWRAGSRLSLTLGLRADGLIIRGRAPYNPAIDSIFGRRTDQMPRATVHLSPRAGFKYDLFGTERDEVRGGVGVFTGRPPLLWEHSAILNYGVGIGSLRCGDLPSDAGPPPAFVPDYHAVPDACGNGRGITSAPLGDVDLLDRRLRMAQTLRFSVAYDHTFPGDVHATIEDLITRNVADFIFVNLNLKGPQGFDRRGRVMYGTVSAAGIATPTLRSRFSEVIDLQNDSQNHSYQLSGRLSKAFSHRWEATASYTHSHVRDVQMGLRAGLPGIVNWSTGRTVSGRHEDMQTGFSLYDLPHRVVLAATYAAPLWRRSTTDFSFYYVGESGTPFTYVATGVSHRGDLNADGATGNDPLYIPRSAFDTAEIVFTGVSDSAGADNSSTAQVTRIATQQLAFDRLVAGTRCLSRQRGRILERNSCREPWSHTSIASVRQSFPVREGHVLTVQLDLFNVLNLLNANWGLARTANTGLLEQVGETPAGAGPAQPVFRFDPSRPLWTILPTESAYQLQVALRYSF